MSLKNIPHNCYTILQIVALDDTGDSCYRMRWPAEALAKRDPTIRIVNLSFSAKERYDYARQADLLVLFNPTDLDMLTVIEARKKEGLKTIVELNDNFYEPAPWFPVAKAWGSINLHLVYEAFMQVADSVMVTGPGLAQLFADKTAAPIKQIKNHLPFKPSPLDELIRSKNCASFGWAGSLGHIADILAVAPSIHATLDQIPNSSFHIMGNDSLETNLRIPIARFKYTPWGNMEQYYEFWRNISVGIIPLLDTPYNRCRSDIKLIEMVATGVVPIVPKLLPYQELTERFDLPSYHDQASLSQALQLALGWSSDVREARLSAIHAYVCSERVESLQGERYDFYRSLLPFKSSQADYFSLARGYQQLNCTASPNPLHVVILQEIQKKIKADEQQIVAAIKQLRELLFASPQHTEYTLALFSLMKKKDSKSALELIQKSIDIFPHDIRFNLAYLTLLTSEQLSKEWLLLLDKVNAASAPYRNNAREMLKSLLLYQLERNPLVLVIVVERYLEIFPQQHRVRLVLATHYEKQGALKEAHRHFSQLLAAKRLLDEGLGEIATIEIGYLAAWDETLRKRLSSLL